MRGAGSGIVWMARTGCMQTGARYCSWAEMLGRQTRSRMVPVAIIKGQGQMERRRGQKMATINGMERGLDRCRWMYNLDWGRIQAVATLDASLLYCGQCRNL